jgi:tryptophan synthase beta subunit
MVRFPITIEHVNGIYVLRDDLLSGGTKSVLANQIVKQNIDKKEFIYASPVYGGFQIALSIYCKLYNKQAVIFCARHKIKHKNTLICKQLGAKIVEIYPGYLSVVQHRAIQYANKSDNRYYINFGAYSEQNIGLLVNRVEKVIEKWKKDPSVPSKKTEPDEIWVAVGSGTLLSAILHATKKTHIYGVQVGANVDIKDPRVTIIKYNKPFEYESKFETPFDSMAHYDRKAFEMLIHYRGYNPKKNILFWNVMA